MKVHVIGGGTMVHVRPHFSLCAPAYGTTARKLVRFLEAAGAGSTLHLSKMAGGDSFETNEELGYLIDEIVDDPDPSIVFMTAAVCDFEGSIVEDPTVEGPHMVGTPSGKGEPRLRTASGEHLLLLRPAEKLLGRIRSKSAPNPRKDIFLVACKTTTGATDDEMFMAGLSLLKTASANLVLVNDIHRRTNMIVTPEQARYGVEESRSSILSLLVSMALSRSKGTFTRSTVVPGDPVPWMDPRIHPALRTVVDHCIKQGAYKDLLGRDATVGHFAQKLDGDHFLTSRRNSNFNKMAEFGLVEVETGADEDSVIAHGFKPSVGGQSQRIIFREHEGLDCIVHAHVPLKPGAGSGTDGYGAIGWAAQWANECGSHQCGQNTSNGLVEVAPGIKAVYLDNHGPNIVFRHDVDPQRVIDYIDQTFDLSHHTGES